MKDHSDRFTRYLQKWWDEQLDGAPYPGDWLKGRSATAIAHEFRRDRQFEVMQATFLHRRPTAELAREIVDRLIPSPVESDSVILVDAVVQAGSTAQKVRATTAIGATVTVFALVLRNILRGR